MLNKGKVFKPFTPDTHMKQNPSVLIVIPTYQEVENIRPLTTRIFQEVPQAYLLFVDDNSLDGTQEEIAKQISSYPNQIFLVRREKKMGLGSAYIAGFQWALERGFDIIIEMDADFSHDPRYLPVLISELKHFDVVIGSRYTKGGGTSNWSWFRKLISRGGSLYAKIILGMPISDLTGGFNAWHAKVLQKIEIATLSSDGYAFQIELKYRAFKTGFKLKEIPIMFDDRRAGQSKMSLHIILEAIWRVWTFKWSQYARQRLLK